MESEALSSPQIMAIDSFELTFVGGHGDGDVELCDRIGAEADVFDIGNTSVESFGTGAARSAAAT